MSPHVVPSDPWAPLPVDWRERLRELWPDAEFLATAWRLAGDINTCRDLLLGLPVSRDRLRPDALAHAEENWLVVLQRPLDLFNVQEAA